MEKAILAQPATKPSLSLSFFLAHARAYGPAQPPQPAHLSLRGGSLASTSRPSKH